MTTEPLPEASRLRAFTLGDWLVEPRACRLSRGDSAVKLRPQLVDLLTCLVRHAGEIALKDEILAEVWPGQYIAESGLSRCIAELRQVLLDEAQQPRYIETIPKRGYRLVAPVVWVEDRQAAPGPVPAAGAESTPPPAAPIPGETEAPPTPHRLPFDWRGRWAAVAMLLVASGVVAVVMLVRTPAAVLTERDTVLLADVRNSTGDAVFDDTLRLALAVTLEQAPFLHILSQEAVRAAVARTGRPAAERAVGPLALDVCRREAAAVLIAGSITPIGSRYAIGLEAVACESGDTISRALVQANSREEVLPALQQATTRIREKLGESRESLERHDVPLERATTRSLEALKLLTLGDESRDHARLADALALYRQATDLDPEFALAWARRGAAARNLELGEEMIPAFRRAFELRDRVSQPERFYIEAHYYRSVEGSPEKALEIYETWKRMYPGSVIPPTNMAGLLAGMLGHYDAAATHAREAVRLAPGSSIAHRNLVLAYLGAGRISDARQAIAEAARRGADDQLMHHLMLNMALLDGDRPALEREVQWAGRAPMTALDALRLRAAAAMGGGRLAEGRRLFSQARASAAEVRPGNGIADVRLEEAEAEALLGDQRAARVAVEAALAADAHPAMQVASAVTLALIGDRARAGAILDGLARQGIPDPGELVVSLPLARALVEAMGGHSDTAAAILQPITRFVRGCDFRLVPLGVVALVEMRAGRPSPAAAASSPHRPGWRSPGWASRAPCATRATRRAASRRTTPSWIPGRTPIRLRRSSPRHDESARPSPDTAEVGLLLVSAPRLRSADEHLRVAGTLRAGHLREPTQRARVGDRTVLQVRGRDGLRGDTVRHPRVERRQDVERGRARTPTAMSHARDEKQAHEVPG
jgi:DNA-binding winged helix-turn-helix (wHTH) protein/tetratricopeptide (TPR) repeat protein